jgi:hypothetical protein
VANVIVVASGHRLHKQLIRDHSTHSFFQYYRRSITLNCFSQDLQLIGVGVLIAFVVWRQRTGAVVLVILVLVASTTLALPFALVFIMLWLVQGYYLQTSQQL